MTWPEPKPATRRGSKRTKGPAITCGTGLRGGAEAIIAGLKLAKLQKAMSETDPSANIVRALPKIAPKIISGLLVLADLLMGPGHSG